MKFLPAVLALALLVSPLTFSLDANAAKNKANNPAPSAKLNDTVVFNPQTKVYHDPSCTYAKRCKSCIKISVDEAKKQGGKPCKVCKGGA